MHYPVPRDLEYADMDDLEYIMITDKSAKRREEARRLHEEALDAFAELAKI